MNGCKGVHVALQTIMLCSLNDMSAIATCLDHRPPLVLEVPSLALPDMRIVLGPMMLHHHQ